MRDTTARHFQPQSVSRGVSSTEKPAATPPSSTFAACNPQQQVSTDHNTDSPQLLLHHVGLHRLLQESLVALENRCIIGLHVAMWLITELSLRMPQKDVTSSRSDLMQLTLVLIMCPLCLLNMTLSPRRTRNPKMPSSDKLSVSTSCPSLTINALHAEASQSDHASPHLCQTCSRLAFSSACMREAAAMSAVAIMQQFSTALQACAELQLVVIVLIMSREYTCLRWPFTLCLPQQQASVHAAAISTACTTAYNCSSSVHGCRAWAHAQVSTC